MWWGEGLRKWLETRRPLGQVYAARGQLGSPGGEDAERRRQGHTHHPLPSSPGLLLCKSKPTLHLLPPPPPQGLEG